MTPSKKQIADHHDNVIRLKVESENISDEFNYIRNKAERDNLYIRTSWDRVVDMKINFYDRIIDLGMFLLKLFIPIFGISFAVGVNILGMDIYTLKCGSSGKRVGDFERQSSIGGPVYRVKQSF